MKYVVWHAGDEDLARYFEAFSPEEAAISWAKENAEVADCSTVQVYVRGPDDNEARLYAVTVHINVTYKVKNQ